MFRAACVPRVLAPALVVAVVLPAAVCHADYDFTPDWYETGTVGDGWGDAVCTVGDVNGDGYSDILVGAPNFGSSPYFGQGKVYLYFGGPSGPGSAPVWEFTQPFKDAKLGYAIAPAGDMNADGYADFVVGAPGHSSSNPSQGKLYFFLGTSGLPQWWTSAQVNDDDAQLGFSVDYAGDVNGDGYDDVIAGAPGWGGFGSPFIIPVQGRAYVYFGGPNGPDGTADWSVAGGDVNADFGWDVAGLGDVNGDGFADVMVGKPGYDPGLIGTDFGAIYAYYGSPTGPSTTADWSQVGANVGDQFGKEISYAGDFNGSGFCDVLIGVPNYQGNLGALYVASGGPSGLGTAGLVQAGFAANWGSCVSNIGDFDGDGRTDFAAGGGLDHDVKVFFGDSIVNVDYTIAGSGLFSDTIASAGDVNGDGLGDFMVTDPLDQNGAGSVRLYFGGLNPLTIPTPIIRVGDSQDHLGSSVASAGDMNGDGIDDLLVGMRGASGHGSALLYYGGIYGMASTPSWTGIAGEDTGEFAAKSAGAGDVNGDGYSDIVVTDSDAQEVHVFYGGAGGPSVSAVWSYLFPTPASGFGLAVCGGGDLNGDGYADIAVGAPLYDGGLVDQGLVRVFFGSPAGLSSGLYVDLESGVADSRFGTSLAVFGDGDGDGLDDLAVGAPGYDPGGAGDSGRVSVFFGDPTGFPAGHMDFDGSSAGNQLGGAVAAGGDVNGDGYADLLVGEPFANAVGLDSGVAHVYFGGATPFVDVVDMEPVTGVTQYGRVLTSLGDPQSTGRSLIAVGGKPSNGNQTVVDVFEYTTTIQLQTQSYIGVAFSDFSMVGAGDVDADASPELALGMPSSAGGDGQVWLLGPFIAHAPLPPAPHVRLTTTLNEPVALRGPVVSGSDLRFQVRGWLPIGRTPLRLQWEIFPERRAYTWRGFGPWTAATTHIGGTDLVADENVNLASDTRFGWRVRLQARNPYVPFGRWWDNPPNTSTLYAFRTVDTATAVEGPPSRDGGLTVEAAPNPFNPRTRFQFELRRPAQVTLSVFDVSGRRVRRIAVGDLEPGEHHIEWDGMDGSGHTVASGVYHALLQAGEESRSLKLTMLK